MPVGLYSISVRDVGVDDLLAWAATARIPFLHLRGGPRGYDIARRDPAELERWRRAAEAVNVPITGVTSDLDLADLINRPAAHGELARLADGAVRLGAGWVRLLARHEPTAVHLAALPDAAVPPLPVDLLAELHHPGWLRGDAPAAFTQLMCRNDRLRLLADTAQLAATHDTEVWERLLPWARVLHLSDDGAGHDQRGRAAVALAAASHIRGGQRIEVAVEWTGSPRTPAECLARYRSALARWRHLAQRSDP
ncbi:AP endonuclease [Streptomyces sp. PT12]|uniref:AP endonuclease n=1 Tax=Streptomyces sp. PT12 TaxID=1510197 RepID=UPI000DE5396E|nr:AP endonuclease [Streptomyces sp. PT12]RBM21190.1 AP endonuclease [Streptomyces sp. PT12]